MKRSDIDAVFRRYGPVVYRRALRILGNPSDAAEATNEVFVRALKSATAFRQKCETVVWLNQITTNYCLNQIRNAKRRNELFREKVYPGGAKNDDTNMDNVLVIRRLLAAADEKQALAACYVFIDGMSHGEAASIMGVSRRTLGNLIDRFLRWGRAYLESEDRSE